VPHRRQPRWLRSHPRTRKKLLAAAQPDTNGLDKLSARIRDLDLKRQRLTDLAVDGHLSPSEFNRKQLELDDEQARIEALLARTPTRQALASLPATKTELEAAWDERGIDYQRLLIDIICQIDVNIRLHSHKRTSTHAAAI
jgi:hypothetical protein